MPSMTPGPSSKGPATRGRIVEAALRVASVEGLEGISLGRVAADVGMSKSGLFAHFTSKEQLQKLFESAESAFRLGKNTVFKAE